MRRSRTAWQSSSPMGMLRWFWTRIRTVSPGAYTAWTGVTEMPRLAGDVGSPQAVSPSPPPSTSRITAMRRRVLGSHPIRLRSAHPVPTAIRRSCRRLRLESHHSDTALWDTPCRVDTGVAGGALYGRRTSFSVSLERTGRTSSPRVSSRSSCQAPAALRIAYPMSSTDWASSPSPAITRYRLEGSGTAKRTSRSPPSSVCWITYAPAWPIPASREPLGSCTLSVTAPSTPIRSKSSGSPAGTVR